MIGGAGKSGAPLRQVDRAEAQRLVRAATQRLGSYQLARRPYEETWRELVRFIAPDRGRLNSQTPQPNDTRRARLQQTSILDRTGTKAVKDLAAFLQRGICSPARPWFRLTVSDQDVADDGAVRAWLDEVRVRMMAVFQASNFYTSMASVFAELGVFGTTAMIVVQDYNDVIRCHPLTIGEFYLATDARGRCGGLIRQYIMTVAQMVERFGRDACSADVCQALDQGRVTEERVVCHSIERNEVKPGAPGWRGMPWRSLWWVLGRDDQVLEVGGFRVMPVISPRWDVVANDTYGHGPGEDALPDVKSLQVYARDRALAVAKMARPPMIGGGSLVSSQIDDSPGALNIFPGPGGNQLAPLYAMQPNLVTLDQGIQDLRNSIRGTFRADLIAMFADSDRREMTAAEVRARQEEKMLLLGPMLDRFQDEALTPIIEIVFDIMAQGGLLPEAPPVLRGRFVAPDYVSLLAQAQRAGDSVAVERFVAFAGSLAQARPEVLDKLDADEAVDQFAGFIGVSPRIVRSDATVADIRRAREQAAMQERQMMVAQQSAQLLEQGAKGAQLMSETEVGGGANLLGTLLGGA